MMLPERFLKDIKFNCDVSDALFWGYFSICGLLIRYRDLYRSEQGLDPWSSIRSAEISAWIARKESRWPELEDRPFRELALGGTTYAPFDSAGINRALQGTGHVYGAGYGMYLKPTFFLARERPLSHISGHEVHTTEREIVRDLFTAPAMLQGSSIYLRLEPLQAILWDRFIALTADMRTAMAEAFRAHGIQPGQAVDDRFTDNLKRMTDAGSKILLQHELAESHEAIPQWKDIIGQAGDRKAELFLRAAQDLVADTSEAGPLKRIAEGRDNGALGLAIGLMEGYRKMLFPEMMAAYGEFQRDGDWSKIEQVRVRGLSRFQTIRRNVLDIFEQGDVEAFRRGLRDMVREIA